MKEITRKLLEKGEHSIAAAARLRIQRTDAEETSRAVRSLNEEWD
jgi:hypothetical protein